MREVGKLIFKYPHILLYGELGKNQLANLAHIIKISWYNMVGLSKSINTETGHVTLRIGTGSTSGFRLLIIGLDLII